MTAERLVRLQVFTPNESAVIADTVKALHRYHVNRGGFYTLGAATYQDDPLAYPAIANAFNPVIDRHFHPILTRVFDILGEHLRAPVTVFPFNVGYPSFHIFDMQCNGTQGHPHIDEPFTRIDLSWLEWSDPFSFTIPVELPAGGGGVDFWLDYTDTDIEMFMADGSLPPAGYIDYEIGMMYLHDGMTPHRIANPCDMAEGEHRITLQGHGIHTERGILVYF